MAARCSLVIHLFPLLTSFCLRWHVNDRQLFPIEHVGFVEYITPPLVFLMIWAVAHTLYMLTIGINLPEGYSTTYRYNMAANGGKNMFTNVLGQIGDGQNEALRLVKHNCISVTMSMVGLAATYTLYTWGSFWIHFSYCLLTCAASVWNGANW